MTKLRPTRANVRRVAQMVRRIAALVLLDDRLTDACDEVSEGLVAVLAASGIKAEHRGGAFVPRRGARGRPHGWVVVVVGRRRLILDVTATQFGRYPKVWFPAPPRHYREAAP